MLEEEEEEEEEEQQQGNNSSFNVRPYNNFGVSGIYQKQTKAASHSHSSAQTLSGLVNPPPSFLSEAAIFFLQVNTLFH